jgi:hypothetical protein
VCTSLTFLNDSFAYTALPEFFVSFQKLYDVLFAVSLMLLFVAFFAVFELAACAGDWE